MIMIHYVVSQKSSLGNYIYCRPIFSRWMCACVDRLSVLKINYNFDEVTGNDKRTEYVLITRQSSLSLLLRRNNT